MLMHCRHPSQWKPVVSKAALLTMFGFVAQILKIDRTESVADVSLAMLLHSSPSIFLWNTPSGQS